MSDEVPFYDGNITNQGGGAVNGGFRAGKRKRGNSPLRRKPRASAVAVTYVIRDEFGNYVTSLKTVTYKRDQAG